MTAFSQPTLRCRLPSNPLAILSAPSAAPGHLQCLGVNLLKFREYVTVVQSRVSDLSPRRIELDYDGQSAKELELWIPHVEKLVGDAPSLWRLLKMVQNCLVPDHCCRLDGVIKG